jgi:thiosulfate reductase / polysulfide reductase chain A
VSLDLLVSHDIFMVPTCQMSDFVLPAAVWGEKYDLHNHWDWHTFMIAGDSRRAARRRQGRVLLLA